MLINSSTTNLFFFFSSIKIRSAVVFLRCVTRGRERHTQLKQEQENVYTHKRPKLIQCTASPVSFPVSCNRIDNPLCYLVAPKRKFSRLTIYVYKLSFVFVWNFPPVPFYLSIVCSVGASYTAGVSVCVIYISNYWTQ